MRAANTLKSVAVNVSRASGDIQVERDLNKGPVGDSRGRYRDEVNGKVDVSNTVTPLGVAVFALKQNKLQLLAPVGQQAQHPEREQTRMKTDPPIEQVIR